MRHLISGPMLGSEQRERQKQPVILPLLREENAPREHKEYVQHEKKVMTKVNKKSNLAILLV